MIAYAWDFKSLLAVLAAIVVVAVLGYRLMHRDAGVWRTRFGFFLERDRYDDGDELGPPPAPRRLPSSLEDTAELKPPDEPPAT